MENASSANACNALLVYPRFDADTFWNFTRTAEVFGAKYPAPPLGLITLAALLPPSWSLRLVNRNTEELSDDDLAWADLVLTGGMMPQQSDTLDIVDLCHAHGKPVVVGGPGVTSFPHLYQAADFRVLGEAEDVIGKFVEAWEAGAREGQFEAEKFQVDVTKSPIPRFDLLKFDDYLHIGVQFSRGCPFTCEFCDIIELYGRVPRAKTNAQMLAELDALYRLGYRGHVDFVDDNLIGNKKAVKAFLPELAAWLEAHDYPFEFTTEASLNLADDAEFLMLMKRANFVGVFVGIESPDTATLIAMRKKQNTRRSIAESIHRLYAAGLFVTAGFIVGFDSETQSSADVMVELIEEAAIPVCMVGLLYALPNTQLTRRLEKEGRLHPASRAGGPENRRPMHDGPQLRRRCGRGRKFSPTTCTSWSASTIRPRMPVVCSVWPRCSTIPDANSSARAPSIHGTSSAAWKSMHRIMHEPARAARHVPAHADPMHDEQSGFDPLDCGDDGSLPARRAILARRDRAHRDYGGCARAGRRTHADR